MPLAPGAVQAPLVEHLLSLERPSPSSRPPGFYDVPDTPLCRRAYAFVQSCLPEWIANHAFRTYAFGIAMANYAGWDSIPESAWLGFNKELIFLACALHELRFDIRGGSLASPLSLELWGGIKAREWLLQQSDVWSVPAPVEGCGIEAADTLATLQEWADEACEAIARHTIEFRNFSSRVRVTGAVVSLGAGMDLLGLGASCIHPEDIATICALWPRLGYVHGLAAHTDLELANKPACLFEDCRMDFNPAMYNVGVFHRRQGQLGEGVGPESRTSTSGELQSAIVSGI